MYFLLFEKYFSHINFDNFAVGGVEPYNISLSHSFIIMLVLERFFTLSLTDGL